MSLTITNKSRIILGALNIGENKYDGKTILEIIDQAEIMAGFIPKMAGIDQRYRGISSYNGCI